MSDVAIRPLAPPDAELLASLFVANREFMSPFDPARPDAFYTVGGQRRELEALVRERAQDRRYRFLISTAGQPAGVISVSNVSRGPFQNANLGYWVAEGLNGRGIAAVAVGLAVAWAFGTARLHRVEAGTLVDNVRSQAVLHRNGFSQIGLSRHHLHIGGAWRDHLLFARTVEG